MIDICSYERRSGGSMLRRRAYGNCLPDVDKLLLALMAALLPLSSLGGSGALISDREPVFTTENQERVTTLAGLCINDLGDARKTESFCDAPALGEKKNKNGLNVTTATEPANSLTALALHDEPSALRVAQASKSAPNLESTVRASLLLAGTMRGFTLGERSTPPRIEADYAALAAYGGNLARIGILLDVDAGLTKFSMSQPERDYMQTTVAMAQKYGFKVVITVTAGPAGGDHQVVWRNSGLQASLATVWAGIATQFKGNPAIAGYELINEPIEPRHRTGQPFNPMGPDEWRPLSIRLINAIRAVDPNSIIVWMPSPGGPEKFWPGFNNPITPLPFSNVVYSVHFYVPQEVTHQGVGNYPLHQIYPGVWKKNKAYVIDRLQYAKAFGEANGVPIFVGEFGFNRNSPAGSREHWFQDCIELFEQYGWNWAAHAFRNWEGWDTELGPEVLPYATGPRRPDAPIITMLKHKFLLNP